MFKGKFDLMGKEKNAEKESRFLSGLNPSLLNMKHE
jgi:hypothetical protein